MKNEKTNNRVFGPGGFSFVESLLSVFLVAFGIVAVFPLINAGMRESMDSRDQVVGVMLAQEGVELVRNLRDNNWAKGYESFKSEAAYPTGFNSNSQTNCRVDTNNVINDCRSNVSTTGRELYIANGNGLYDHTSSATPTNFRRKIDLAYFQADGTAGNQSNAASAVVTSMVSWKTSSVNFPATLAGCTAGNKCAYTQITLTRWGENL